MVDLARAPAAESIPSTSFPPAPARSGRAIGWRFVVAGCILVLLAYGTFIGNDGDWPFGPLRQYAGSTRVSSQVLLTHVYGVHPSGRVVRLNTEALGLRVAELDGQLPRLRRHPELLRPLAAIYQRKYPERARLVRLIIKRDGKVIRNRKVVGEIHRVVAAVDV
jgi:hypothetical protein